MREQATVPESASGAEPAVTDASIVPANGKSPANWAVIGIFLLLAVAAISFARDFLMPVVLAFLLALVFAPVRRFLERQGVASWISAMLITAGLVAGLLAVVFAFATPVSSWIERAPLFAAQLQWKLSTLRTPIESLMQASEKVKELASSGGATGEQQDVQKVVVQNSGIAADLAEMAPAVAAQIVLTLVLLFFLIASGDMFYEKIVHAMPTLKDKRTSMRIAFDIERKLSHYLFTITVINACLGAAIGIAMWVIGLPQPFLFGIAGFLLNYIPYVGAITGVVLATLVGILTFFEVGRALLAGGVYMMLTFLEGYLVTPYFVGRRLRLNTVVVLMAVTFWAWLWSVVGMLIAVPILVAIRTFCDHIPQLENVGHFLASRKAEVEDREVAREAFVAGK